MIAWVEGTLRDKAPTRIVVDVRGVRHATRDFPAGTLIVKSSQPHRRLLRTLLQFPALAQINV